MDSVVVIHKSIFKDEKETFFKKFKRISLTRNLCSDLVVKQCYLNITVQKSIPSKMWKYEDQYRGREFPGFINYRTFEDIIKEQILDLEEPAIVILNNVIRMSYRPHEAITWVTLVCLIIAF